MTMDASIYLLSLSIVVVNGSRYYHASVPRCSLGSSVMPHMKLTQTSHYFACVVSYICLHTSSRDTRTYIRNNRRVGSPPVSITTTLQGMSVRRTFNVGTFCTTSISPPADKMPARALAIIVVARQPRIFTARIPTATIPHEASEDRLATKEPTMPVPSLPYLTG